MEEKSRQNREKSLKILGIQMSSVVGDKWENFSKIADLIDKNIKKGTDIIILPEVWSIGWMPSEFKDTAENIENSETIEFLSEIAQKYNVNIIGGSFITKKGSKYFNTCPVINRNGELVATYDKMHLFSYDGCDEGNYLEKGSNPIIVDIDGIKIGLSICYDIRFPEIYRAYRKAGADLLINTAAMGSNKKLPWDILTRARAIENQCYVIAVDQCGFITSDDWNLGHSSIIDYKGEIISELKNNDEGAMFAEIRFNEMYKFREKYTVLLDIHDTYEVK